MVPYRCIRLSVLAGAAVSAFTASAAQAQSGTAVLSQPQASPPSPAVTAPEGSAEAAYGEIVVTAQKRSERLKDVPESVSVLNAPDLAQQGIVRFSDYANRIPGLSLTSVRTGQAQVTLRGITTGASQSASSTGYYIDEAPIGSVNAYTGGSSTTPDLDPSDLKQIEVLKGPQGTLYGAGAVGGLLKFETTPADLEHLAGSVSAGVNGVSQGGIGYSARGLINIPLVSDILALRVSGFYRRDAGYIDNVNPRIGRNDVNSARVRGGRAVLAIKLAKDVRLDLSALAQDTSTSGTNTVDVDAASLQPLYGDLTQNRNVQETGFVKFRLYNATLHADAGGINLVSSTTYQHTNYTSVTDGTDSYGALLGPLFGIPGLGIVANQTTRTERWSEEVRAGADRIAGLLDLQAGFYWTHENDTNRIPDFAPFATASGAALPLPNIVTAAILSKYNEYSFFGNARVYLTPRFDILAGGRFSHDHQDYLQDYSGLIVGPRRINTGVETANIGTWMVSPRYRFSSDAMIYARAASGYRPGGPNAVPPPAVYPAPNTFAPDRLTQYEVGFKGSALDQALTLDAAVFYTKWKNIQIQTSAAGFNFFVNGGDARSQGAELTLRYQPIKGLTFGANGAYTDAKLTSPAPAAGGIAGDRLPYVPRWSGSLTAEYSVPVTAQLSAVFDGGVNFTGNRISDYSARFAKVLPNYATVDLRAGLNRGNFNVSVFARNLTDKRAINVAQSAGLAPSSTPGAVYYASYIQPRTVGAEATLKF